MFPNENIIPSVLRFWFCFWGCSRRPQKDGMTYDSVLSLCLEILHGKKKY